MTWLEAIGPLAGVLGLTVAVLSNLAQLRRESRTENLDVERLGHDDLVAALEDKRAQIADMRAEMSADDARHEREVAEWKLKADTAEAKASTALEKLTDLLFLIETRREDR